MLPLYSAQVFRYNSALKMNELQNLIYSSFSPIYKQP